MEDYGQRQVIAKLHAEHSKLMDEYAECVKNGDVFEKKRNLVGKMRDIEKEIMVLGLPENDMQKVFGK